MNFFSFDVKKVIFVLLILIIPLVMINVKHSPENTPWYFRPFTFAVSVTQSGVYGFFHGVRSTTAHYLNLMNVKTENRRLHLENEELKVKLALLNECREENNRLNHFFNFSQTAEMQLIAAQVIGLDLLLDHSTITIDRGTRDSIEPGMAVVTPEAVLGYILKPDMFTSQVLLITDRYAAVDAIVHRTRARGIIEGRTKDSCQLRYLERPDDVTSGDLVVTSDFDKKFPKGFPIGIVQEVTQTGYGSSLKVVVNPIVERHKLEEVFIVKKAVMDKPSNHQETVDAK